jgi:hypothetical protein
MNANRRASEETFFILYFFFFFDSNERTRWSLYTARAYIHIIYICTFSRFVKVTGYPRDSEPYSCMGGNVRRDLMTSAFQLTYRNEEK